MAQVLQTGVDTLHKTTAPDLMAALPEHPQRASISPLRPTSFMAVCLTLRSRPMGVIGFARCGESTPFDADDFSLAKEMARRTAIALDNASLYDSLRQADQRKDTFPATPAHELRNPLAPIHNAAAILPAIKGNPVKIEAMARMITRQVTQMTRLIDDLMDISRISLGKIKLQRDVCVLQELLNEAIEVVQPILDESGLTLYAEIPAQQIRIDADRVRVLQALGNLMNNACNYTARGVEIYLSLSREESRHSCGFGIRALAWIWRISPHGFRCSVSSKAAIVALGSGHRARAFSGAGANARGHYSCVQSGKGPGQRVHHPPAIDA